MDIPLAQRMRPTSLQEIAGQIHLLGKNSFLMNLIEKKKKISLLFWGPPGTGKTTLAKIYGKTLGLPFYTISASMQTTAEIKDILKQMEKTPLFAQQIVLFIDELHRFSKLQQDMLLPLCEEGKIILLAATTENPSFHINNALLSRLHTLTLKPLSQEELKQIFHQVEEKVHKLEIEADALNFVMEKAGGDARAFLNMMEILFTFDEKITLTEAKLAVSGQMVKFDKKADHHYQLISALHKAIRGSDPDAALYWLERILLGSEDLLFIARRLTRAAMEDVGLADPNAMQLSLTTFEVCRRLGSPEAEIALAELTLYLALSPKSNRVYLAQNQAKQLAESTSHLPPPDFLCPAPTKFLKEQGKGKNYQYDHDTKNTFSGQNYFPKEVSHQIFYHPKEVGFERELLKRTQYFQKLREQMLARSFSRE